jgi:diaminopropionate ammonia-lyase
MLIHNTRATRAPYPDALRAVLNIAAAQESHQWLSHWPHIASRPTPLWSLPDLAARLGIATLSVKDESKRSMLESFKALGAPIALVRLVLRLFPEAGMSAATLFQGQHAQALAHFTVVSATDGNHGRALAAAAKSIGCHCVIIIHRAVSDERRIAIESFGAEVIRIDGTYDESVQGAARLAQDNGWQVVSDTSYAGYETIPRDVMQGYGIISSEILSTRGTHHEGVSPFTHIFIQGGVGGLAAGVASYFSEYFGIHRPTFIMVEPEQADCLFQSAKRGMASAASGSVDSIMAGLACGDTSPLAWRFLENIIDYFVTIQDQDAVHAMVTLATGSRRDVPIVAGESGAAGLAGLIAVASNVTLRDVIDLDAQSSVLIINTEGATAPALYETLVGRSGDDVLDKQRDW